MSRACFCFQYPGFGFWLLIDSIDCLPWAPAETQRVFFTIVFCIISNGDSAPPPQPPPKESLARRYRFLRPMHLAVNVAVGSPFPFIIPQLCNFLFTLIYCVYFVYKVIKFIKWWYGFWDFSFKELFLKLIKCFSWYCFVDGYSVVRIGVMVLVLVPKDSLIQSQREGRRGYYD